MDGETLNVQREGTKFAVCKPPPGTLLPTPSWIFSEQPFLRLTVSAAEEASRNPCTAVVVWQLHDVLHHFCKEHHGYKICSFPKPLESI